MRVAEESRMSRACGPDLTTQSLPAVSSSVGKLPLAARILLWPVLLGQRLSLQYYRRQCRPWDEAAPGVWIGRRLDDDEAAGALRDGVTAVLDLTCEFSEATPLLGVKYRNIPVLDLTSPTIEQLREAIQFITRQVTAGGTVYLHCKIGYSRSAAVVGAYLLTAGLAASAEEAVARLRSVRPSIVVRPEARAALEEWERHLKETASDSA